MIWLYLVLLLLPLASFNGNCCLTGKLLCTFCWFVALIKFRGMRFVSGCALLRALCCIVSAFCVKWDRWWIIVEPVVELPTSVTPCRSNASSRRYNWSRCCVTSRCSAANCSLCRASSTRSSSSCVFSCWDATRNAAFSRQSWSCKFRNSSNWRFGFGRLLDDLPILPSLHAANCACRLSIVVIWLLIIQSNV